MSDPSEISRQHWDVIVVGTGMGAATAGYALARSGQRVLFCEKGLSPLAHDRALCGGYAETFFPYAEVPQPKHAHLLSRAGRYVGQVEDRSSRQIRNFVPFVGEGAGGSSALYGMALERFFPADFEPRRNFPGASETTLPEAWPISYSELVPYYESAERLYRVRGTPDLLRAEDRPIRCGPPPALTPAAAELFEFFRRRGLHPYRLPLACEFVAGCQCCQGYLCERNCKNDAGRICLEPAISLYGAKLLDGCEVVKLEANRTTVTGVVCKGQDGLLTLRGKVVVLGAGALETPGLLLNSASPDWPQGLANDVMLVGKNLMRHYIDLYLVTPQISGALDNRQKEFAFNDFYQTNGSKLGSVQSFGRLPPASVLAASLAQDLRDGPLPWLSPLLRLARPVLTSLLERLVERSMVLATILEDLPYADNLITAVPEQSRTGGARLSITYKIRTHEKERIEAFRAAMKSVLEPYRYKMLKQAENNQRIGHACGTCRFGLGPRASVLDKHNRAHGLSNLYVVDSSFFPSSSGTNPSLTIAANALRVADAIL